MARISSVGFDRMDAWFQKIGTIPWPVMWGAIDDMAIVAEKAVRATGKAMGVRDPKSRVHILNKVTHTIPKVTASGAFSDVTFSGNRKRGNTRTRNAEIAFINEYGKAGQQPRPFIRTAVAQYGDQIAAAGEKALGDWMEETFNKG